MASCYARLPKLKNIMLFLIDAEIYIIKDLRGFTSGYAIPQFVIDAPGGGGKIPLNPDFVKKFGENSILLNNFLGKTYECILCHSNY